jgi:hypothetical protein
MPTTLRLTHLDKMLFPECGVSEGDLIEHYRSVAAWMLPHVHDRPMAMTRYPDGIDKPSFMQQAAHAARALRELLDELGWPSLVKTTGGLGLHVHVPLVRRYDADTLRGFARSVCAVLESRELDLCTSEMRKNKREGRLLLDMSRNAYAQRAVHRQGHPGRARGHAAGLERTRRPGPESAEVHGADDGPAAPGAGSLGPHPSAGAGLLALHGPTAPRRPADLRTSAWRISSTRRTVGSAVPPGPAEYPRRQPIPARLRVGGARGRVQVDDAHPGKA